MHMIKLHLEPRARIWVILLGLPNTRILDYNGIFFNALDYASIDSSTFTKPFGFVIKTCHFRTCLRDKGSRIPFCVF